MQQLKYLRNVSPVSEEEEGECLSEPTHRNQKQSNEDDTNQNEDEGTAGRG